MSYNHAVSPEHTEKQQRVRLCGLTPAGRPRATMSITLSHSVLEVGLHLAVQLINGIDCRGEINEEFPDLLQAVVFLHIPTLGEGPQEVGLVGSGEKSRLEDERRDISSVSQRGRRDPGLTLKNC